MQYHSPTKVPCQVTQITTFHSNKYSMFGKFPCCLIAILSYCRTVLRFTWKLLWLKVQSGNSSLWSLSFNYATSSVDPYTWPVFFDDTWNSAAGENRTVSNHSLISVGEEPIAKTLKRNAIRGSISVRGFAYCPRFFAARKATSGKRWSVRDKRCLSLSLALSILPSLTNLSSHRSSKNG